MIRGSDHRPNEPIHRGADRGARGEPPEYVHFGLVLGPDGKKLSKRPTARRSASLRDAGIPPEAVRALPRGARLAAPRRAARPRAIRSLAVEALAALSDEELAGRLGVPASVVPALRGAHDLVEARDLASSILDVPRVSLPDEHPTLERFRELRSAGSGSLDKDGAKAIVRELKAVGGNLRAVRRALTGRDSGPELWAVLAALPRDETLRRVDAAL